MRELALLKGLFDYWSLVEDFSSSEESFAKLVGGIPDFAGAVTEEGFAGKVVVPNHEAEVGFFNDTFGVGERAAEVDEVESVAKHVGHGTVEKEDVGVFVDDEVGVVLNDWAVEIGGVEELHTTMLDNSKEDPANPTVLDAVKQRSDAANIGTAKHQRLALRINKLSIADPPFWDVWVLPPLLRPLPKPLLPRCKKLAASIGVVTKVAANRGEAVRIIREGAAGRLSIRDISASEGVPKKSKEVLGTLSLRVVNVLIRVLR